MKWPGWCLFLGATPLATAPVDDLGLIGRIEGRHDGRERRIDYSMKRVACPGGSR
ncbi:MAG TPA: hypothetical protein VFU71_07665 [Burkholderiaceae bacterium]|nr:hypothetical protein [Burkholderiaceae bacterium]